MSNACNKRVLRYSSTFQVPCCCLGTCCPSASKAHMYRCICKRCGHRVNRLFINPLQLGKRWVFACPNCRHKTDLPSFCELGSQVIHSAKCLTPLLAAVTRNISSHIGGQLGKAGATSATFSAFATVTGLRRKYAEARTRKLTRRRELTTSRLVALRSRFLLSSRSKKMRPA